MDNRNPDKLKLYRETNNRVIEILVRQLMHTIRLPIKQSENVSEASESSDIQLLDKQGNHIPTKATLTLKYAKKEGRWDTPKFSVTFDLNTQTGETVAYYFFEFKKVLEEPGVYMATPAVKVEKKYESIGIGKGFADRGEEMIMFFSEAIAQLLNMSTLRTQIIDSTRSDPNNTAEQHDWTLRFIAGQYQNKGYQKDRLGSYYKDTPVTPAMHNTTIYFP